MPQTIDALWQYFGERDAFLFALVAVLVFFGVLCASRLVDYEDYFREHTPAAKDFDLWRAKRKRAHLCPKDNIVLMRGSCPICGWKPE
jgi:hypothetical protein